MAKSAGAATRQRELTEALTNGVHWGQVLLCQKLPGRADPNVFSAGTLAAGEIATLVQAFEKLLATPPRQLAAWVKGRAAAPEIPAAVTALNRQPRPASDRLPVNVITAELARRLGGKELLSAQAVANLLQFNLQEDKDGTLLQDLFRLYIELRCRVNLAHLGLPAQEADLLALAGELAAKSAKGPFPANDAAYWNLSLNRIEMWGDKNSGRRDKFVLAKELLQDPEIKPLAPALKSLPAKRAAFLGYSMMMSLHWSSYGSWNDLAAEAVRALNPRLDYRGFQYGGIHAVAALKNLLPEALEYKPTETFLLLAVSNAEDQAAFEAMIGRLQEAGSAVYVVDDVRPWIEKPFPNMTDEISRRRESARKTGARLLDFMAAGKAVPGSDSWACLDTIHMKTAGHVFYAKELLKLWSREAH